MWERLSQPISSDAAIILTRTRACQCTPASALLSSGESPSVYRVCLELDDSLFEALPAHGSGYAPHWSAPTLHSSVQEQRYGGPVPYINDMAHGYGALTNAQQSTSFAPAMVSITQRLSTTEGLFFFYTECHDFIQQPEPES